MELDDINIELQELPCPPDIIRHSYDAGLNDYFAQYEDLDVILRISGLQDSHNLSAQTAGISSRPLNMEINHSNHPYYLRDQPIQTADFRLQEACDHDQLAATEISMNTFLHSPFDHVNANDPAEDFAAAGKRAAMHDQPVAAGRLAHVQSFASDRSCSYDQRAPDKIRLLHVQSSASDHSHTDHEALVSAGRLMYVQTSATTYYGNDGSDYPAGLTLEAAYKGAAAASRQRRTDHYDDQHAGVSSEEEGVTFSSSKEEEQEEEKKRTSAGTRSGSSRKPLHTERDSRIGLHVGPHSMTIKKRAAPFIPPPQYRRPIIIHTYSPKIIHTSPSKFMWLVQSLTGSPETRSRCLKNPLDADHLTHLLRRASAAASMEAQDANVLPSAAPMQANFIQQDCNHHHQYDTSPASPLNSPATTPNYSLNCTRNVVSPPNYSPNTTSNVINTSCSSSNHNINQSYTTTSGPLMLSSHNHSPNHIELWAGNTEQSSSSTISCCSQREVSPRGPLIYTREGEGVAHAKPFLSRGINQLDSNTEGSVHSSNFFQYSPCNLSNPKDLL